MIIAEAREQQGRGALDDCMELRQCSGRGAAGSEVIFDGSQATSGWRYSELSWGSQEWCFVIGRGFSGLRRGGVDQ